MLGDLFRLVDVFRSGLEVDVVGDGEEAGLIRFDMRGSVG